MCCRPNRKHGSIKFSFPFQDTFFLKWNTFWCKTFVLTITKIQFYEKRKRLDTPSLAWKMPNKCFYFGTLIITENLCHLFILYTCMCCITTHTWTFYSTCSKSHKNSKSRNWQVCSYEQKYNLKQIPSSSCLQHNK